jgi:phosphohistidine phosphatase
MPKTLYLVRHAKTEQGSYDQSDFSRELKSRGMRDATLVGNKLKEEGHDLDLIITSTASRARVTADIMASQMGFDVEKVHLNDELYMASVRTFLQAINSLKPEWDNVMMVGHNPIITYLGEYLTDEEVGAMPTGAVMVIQFDFDNWESVSQRTGILKYYLTPKMLKANE